MNRKVLRMTHVRQGDNTSCCGPYSLYMIAKYHGVETTPRSLITRCKSSTECGTSYRNINRVIKELGLKRFHLQFDEIIASIRSGYPVLVCLEDGWDKKDGQIEYHYSVIKGFDKDKKIFIMQDPYELPGYEQSFSEIEILLEDQNWIWGIRRADA